MPQPDKPGIPWNEIRNRLVAGESANALAREYPVSKQAILKRKDKEGWLLGATTKSYLAIARQPVAPQSKGDPEVKAEIIEALRQGATWKLAANRVRVTDRTIRNWRDEDPDFSAACEAALSEFAQRHVVNLGKASDRGDVNAAKWLLERHPATRTEYQPAQQAAGGPSIQVVLNIPKPEPINVIDAEAVVVEQLESQ